MPTDPKLLCLTCTQLQADAPDRQASSTGHGLYHSALQRPFVGHLVLGTEDIAPSPVKTLGDTKLADMVLATTELRV